jgi:hypothetical protein
MGRKWFRAKRYGYGWYPSSWQGWLVLLVYLVDVIGASLLIDKKSHSVSDTLMDWFPIMFVLTIILIVICYRTGEKARWNWGRK